MKFAWVSGLLCGGLLAGCQTAADKPDPLGYLPQTKPVVTNLQFSPIFEGRGDGVHTCPVTGEKITGETFKAEYFGRTVYFCCEGCLQSARRSPQRFIKPTPAEQEQAVKAYLAQSPEAPKGEEFCTE